MHTKGRFYIRHQLLVEEVATASISNNVPSTKSVSTLIFYTEQLDDHPTRREFKNQILLWYI